MGAERARCWLARLSFVLAAAAVVIVPVFAGLKSLAMLAIGLAAVAVSIVSGYLFAARRRLVRWLSLLQKLAHTYLGPDVRTAVTAIAAPLPDWPRPRGLS